MWRGINILSVRKLSLTPHSSPLRINAKRFVSRCNEKQIIALLHKKKNKIEKKTGEDFSDFPSLSMTFCSSIPLH